MAFSVTIDVNPSIDIKVRKDGTIKSVKAGNKDAAKIVKQVNKKIDKDTDYDKVINLVMKQLRGNGYLKKENSAMLVSVISNDKNESKDKLGDIKERTKKAEASGKIKCTTMYQACEKNKNTEDVAKKNNVSLGKAALCVKLAEKENTSVQKLCKKNIDTLIKKTEETKIAYGDDAIVIEGALTLEPETPAFDTESFVEQESTSENIALADETTELESEDDEDETTETSTEETTPTGISLIP